MSGTPLHLFCFIHSILLIQACLIDRIVPLFVGVWHSDNDTATLLLHNDALLHPPTFAPCVGNGEYAAEFKAFAEALSRHGVNVASVCVF